MISSGGGVIMVFPYPEGWCQTAAAAEFNIFQPAEGITIK
jgi:hypothetical protein